MSQQQEEQYLVVGDLVKPSLIHTSDDEWVDAQGFGIVLALGVQMWGEETIPHGVKVLWQNTMEIEVTYEDELELVERPKSEEGDNNEQKT